MWWSLSAADGRNTYTSLCIWEDQVWMFLLHIRASISALWLTLSEDSLRFSVMILCVGEMLNGMFIVVDNDDVSDSL